MVARVEIHCQNHTPLLFKGGRGVFNAQSILSHFLVSHCYLYINEGAQRLKPGDPSAINNPKTLHVLLRPKGAIFVFLFQDFQKFPPDSNVISGKIRSARAPDLQMARFDLPLSALLQCLLLRAVRSLLLMRSLTEATELYTGMELHISACCPNQAEL